MPGLTCQLDGMVIVIVLRAEGMLIGVGQLRGGEEKRKLLFIIFK